MIQPAEVDVRRAEAIIRSAIGTWSKDGNEDLEDLVDVAKKKLAQAITEQRTQDMAAVCRRCRLDSRGPGQHEIEKCEAAAIRKLALATS